MTASGGADPREVALPEDVLVACLKAVDPLNGLIDWQPSVSYDGMTREHIRDIARILGPHLSATALAAAEAKADAVDRRVGELEVDKARLDFLDRCNTALNEHYGTAYRWRLVLNHNVNRLMLGNGDVDLHDSDGSNTALPSCREAIDAQMRERAAARALAGSGR